MQIAITGATGLIGKHLAARLGQTGHTPIPLRRAASGENSWNPETGAIQTNGPLDALVHFAGKNIATRWTTKAKKEIWDSRVTATEKLSAYLAQLPPPQRPRLFISTSATGIYGNRGDEVLTEDSAIAPPNVSFLADICRGWEAATKSAENAGIRVIHFRIGVVLAKESGALAKMLTPTKLGLGGPVGKGTQWLSWISLSDITRLLVHLIEHDGSPSTGVINAVAPNPVRQHEFIRTLGRVVHRPTVFPMPSPIVKMIFGQMGTEVLLGSQRVHATRLPPDFQFQHPTLESAMREELQVTPTVKT